VPDDVAVNADAVTNGRLHVRTSFLGAVPTGWQYQPRRSAARCNGPIP